MLLTKECDYGMRIIRRLADGERKTVMSICNTEEIPVPYAYKITKKLEHAGLLQSLRGQNGGYQLAKSLDMITLYDIATAVDENCLVFACLAEGTLCPFHHADQPCAVHLEFKRIQDLLVSEMQAKTIGEVLLA
ncbi:MAG: Rrf2 family transcriptional regulator [Oscillospiraceae bacterium]|nr:Rrf2 family transcriptional regulator [Oscillospiraceae bacterium]